MLRVRRSTHLRVAWGALALGVVLFNVANLVSLWHGDHLTLLPGPAISDVPFLMSYVAFVIGVVLMTQYRYGWELPSVQLDGAVAGLSLAALATLLWFSRILVARGHPLDVAVRMAYPLLDLVLLVVLVSGLAPSRYRPNFATSLMVGGFALFDVGDVIYLNERVAGTYHRGTLLDATWVVALWLVGLAASAPEERRRAARASATAPPSVAAVPIVFATLSVMTLGVAVVNHSSRAASLFAIGALCLVVLRMALTLREVRNVEQATFVVARVDDLTGLANRRSFMESAANMLDSLEHPRQLGVILIDLDGFKEVNDSLGHACGDELLRVVGKRFARHITARAIIARVGGDEFACALVFDDFHELVDFGNELEAILTDPIALDGVIVRVSTSIGIAIYPDHGLTQVELMRSADVAMYEAKRTHSTICLYHPDFDLNSRDRLAMIGELRGAIEAGHLVLHYQVTKDLRSGHIHGIEALVRWNHPIRGVIFPDDFIPMAERVGLIIPLTRSVLRLAIDEMARLDRNGHRLNMSVNISHLDLVDERLPSYITMLLLEYGIDPARLTLEVTESSLGGDPARTRHSIEQLRDLGIRISIDDFGVGYSSMSQLLELPIDELKIDKTFVFALENDVRARAVISSTIELGRALNVTVVAEGIETFSNHELVRNLGADIAQGYFIARPKTSQEIDDYLGAPASLR
jgi:diguanylate cyclase (GGDEF)-like protein